MGEGTGPFRCPGCQTATLSDLDWCPKCGFQLRVECSKCGGTWRYFYNYRFCPSCGTAAPAESKKVERR